MAQTTSAQQLYDLLVSRNFDPELLDSAGRPSSNPAETDVFSFDFTTESGNDYGTVVVMLNEDNDMELYFGDNIGRGMEADDKQEWFDFLYQLRMFAKRNLMSFGLKNLNRLRYSMQGQAAIKEGLFESWSGTRTQSWNGKQTEARLMIKHKRPLGETDARFRYVESLFVETAEGERYKLPFTKLSGGRAMVEHVRNGGKPYDLRGQHIAEMVNELNVLSRFRRANHGKIFEGDTAQLIEQTNSYYETAQRTLKSLSTRNGYTTYFESWNPEEVTEQDMVIEGLKHLFVTQTLDQRIEEALPILARIQQGTEMKEANIFEAWVDRIVEGTWAVPDTPEKRDTLRELMSKEFPVGADATNATEQLYDLIGDDELFDQLENLAQQNPDADCRQVVYDRMQELADNPDIAEVMASFTMDADTPVEPAEPVQEGRMGDVAAMYDDWINSEYAPMDDEAGDDKAVMGKAIAFLRGAVPDDKIEPIAQLMAQQYHGGDFDLAESEYDYGSDLATILKRAGVDDTVIAAPDYETTDYEDEVDEGMLGGIGGGAAGAMAGASLGGIPGAIIGGLLGAGAGDSLTDEAEETDEGWKGQLAGGALGTLAGGAVGGPIGAALGGTAGQMIGDKLGGEEETDESAPLQGQYGHSGKMKKFESIESDVVSRLKELSGLLRTDK